jgi:hypothetical protein
MEVCVRQSLDGTTKNGWGVRQELRIFEAVSSAGGEHRYPQDLGWSEASKAYHQLTSPQAGFVSATPNCKVDMVDISSTHRPPQTLCADQARIHPTVRIRLVILLAIALRFPFIPILHA